MKTALAIPIKNERKGLPLLVEALRKQLSRSDEMIFVDAGSTDGGLELLRQYAAKDTRIKVYVSEGAYSGKGRNVAIEHTDADIIAHIDGGNLPDERWLSELVKPILKGQADYVMGNVKFMPIHRTILGMKIDMAPVYGASLFRVRGRRGPVKHDAPAGGASVAYKREIWKKAHGLPDWLPSGEDPVFARKVMQQDIGVAFVDKAVLYWQIGPSITDFLRRHIRNQMMLFRTPESVRRGLGVIIVHLCVLTAVVASFIFPVLWKVPVAFLLVMLARQNAKSIKTYTHSFRKEYCPSNRLFAIALFPFLDLAGILVRVVATVRGLISLRRGSRDWTTRVEEYLSR